MAHRATYHRSVIAVMHLPLQRRGTIFAGRLTSWPSWGSKQSKCETSLLRDGLFVTRISSTVWHNHEKRNMYEQT